MHNATWLDVIYMGFALAILVMQFVNSRNNRANTKAIEKVAHETNSIKDELVKEVRAASIALGEKQAEDRAKLKK